MAIKRTISVLLLVALALLAQPIPPPSPIPYVSACGEYQCASGTWTSAQILSMAATPVTVIPAAGAGTLVQPLSFAFELVYGGTAYTGSGSLTIRYVNNAGTQLANACATAFINATSNNICLPNFNANTSIAANIEVNQPVIAGFNSTVSTGNGTVRYRVGYRIIKGF